MKDEERIEHLEHIIRGHVNVQETIRAFDTKSSILFTFASAVIAGTWQILSKLTEIIAPLDFKWECIQRLGILAALGSACFCGMALIQCLLTFLARGYPDGSKLPTTVLFPYIPRNCQGHKDYLAEKIANKMNKDDIHAEYLCQLNTLGEIVAKKIAHNQKAMRMLIFQILSVSILVIIYFCMLLAG
jgi:hypothetical protein